MKTTARAASFLFIVFGLLFSSCIKDEPEIRSVTFSADAEWGIPLAQIHLTAERVIDNFDKEGIVLSGEDGLVRIVYTDTLDPIRADDFLVLPDQSFDASFSLGAAAFAQLQVEGSVSVSETRTYAYPAQDGDRLDSVRFESGIFEILVQTAMNVQISGTVSLLDPETDEPRYTYQFNDFEPPVLVDETASMEDVLLTFDNTSDEENLLKVSYDFDLNYAGAGSNADISIDFSFSDLQIRAAGGFIVPRDLELEDEGLFVTMFNDLGTTQVRIEDPRINFYFDNGFGIGSQLLIDEIIGTNAAGELLPVPGSNITELPVLAPAPVPGTSVLTQIEINNDLMTPSVTDFLAFYPNFVSGNFALRINPGEDENSFISRDASLRLSYEAEIPVYGSIADFNMRDTADINLTDVIEGLEEAEPVQEAEIRLIIDNGLPLEAGLQIVFTDSLYQPVDSLFSGFTEVLPSAPLELSVPETHPHYGRSLGTTRSVITVTVARERLEAMDEVTKMIFRIVGNTTSNGDHPIRLFHQDAFSVRAAARVKLRFDE